MMGAGEGRALAPRLDVTVTLGLLAFVLMLAFQTMQLLRERDNMAAVRTSQETPIQDAVKLRQQLEALAGDTAKLADGGNANAKQVVEAMRRQGVSLQAPAK